jgi:hypothetical protein
MNTHVSKHIAKLQADDKHACSYPMCNGQTFTVAGLVDHNSTKVSLMMLTRRYDNDEGTAHHECRQAAGVQPKSTVSQLGHLIRNGFRGLPATYHVSYSSDTTDACKNA